MKIIIWMVNNYPSASRELMEESDVGVAMKCFFQVRMMQRSFCSVSAVISDLTFFASNRNVSSSADISLSRRMKGGIGP